tara:strand:+ start:432 stop:1160 length:729 start_codon:yes stop_codon:yes gene_type:complete
MKYYMKKYSSLLKYYIKENSEEVKSGLIAFLITFITFMFLNISFKPEPLDVIICEDGECSSIKAEKIIIQNTKEVDDEFIDSVKKVLDEPLIESSTHKTFLDSMDKCIDYVYLSVSPEHQLPKKLVLAQAILESAWGKSRFANEGNNLFGIRTFDKSTDYLLPITWDPNKWPGWGVKVYESKCASVRDYVRIINEVWAYEELREARKSNPNITAIELASYLDKFSTNPNYENLVVRIIETKL